MIKKIVINIAFFFVTALLPPLAFGQYYPSPQPENPANENTLLKQFAQNISGKEKIDVLLRLANLNLNKPLRHKADLKRALDFGMAARDLSIKYRDKKNTDAAQLLIADIFTFQGNMKAAENILPALKDTSRAELCLNLGFKYRLQSTTEGERKKVIEFAEETRRLAKQYKLPLYDIMACTDIALIHLDQSTGAPELELLEVLKRARALRYPNLQYIYVALTEYYHVKGIPDKAEYYCLEAINSIKTTRDTLILGDVYGIYALINYNRGNLQKALDLTNTSLGYLKIHAGQFSLPDREIGAFKVRVLRKMKRYPEALAYAKKFQAEYPAETIAIKVRDIKTVANVYRDMKDYHNSERLFLTALSMNVSHHITEMDLYKDLGQLYVESGQYRKAKPYLYKVFNQKDDPLASAQMSHLNYMLFLADSATRDYLSAIKHLNSSRRHEDLELRQKMEQETKRLDIQFDTKQKEEKIKFLNEKTELDKRNLHEANLLKDVTITGILLALIIAGLLYRQNRRKQRTNELITDKNQLLQNLVEEKEWLLKEVHHRVKNNLQIVMSLLYTQSAYLQNTDAKDAIMDSQNRVQAISIIHQKLYSKSNVASIMMADYVSDLVRYLCTSYDCNRLKIKVRQELDSVMLDISQAVPMGLILNEAITNCIKYAFDGNGGDIHIEGRLSAPETVTLTITDNGRGLPHKFDLAETSSLGMEMMKALSKQLGGGLEISTGPGVRISIRFKVDQNKMGPALPGMIGIPGGSLK